MLKSKSALVNVVTNHGQYHATRPRRDLCAHVSHQQRRLPTCSHMYVDARTRDETLSVPNQYPRYIIARKRLSNHSAAVWLALHIARSTWPASPSHRGPADMWSVPSTSRRAPIRWCGCHASSPKQLECFSWGVSPSPAPDCLVAAITTISTLSVVKLSLPRDDLRKVCSSMKSRPHTIICQLVPYELMDTKGQPWTLARAIHNLATAGSLHTISLEYQQAITLTNAGNEGPVQCWPPLKIGRAHV